MVLTQYYTKYCDKSLEIDENGIRLLDRGRQIIDCTWDCVYKVVAVKSFRPWVCLVEAFSTARSKSDVYPKPLVELLFFYRKGGKKKMLWLYSGFVDIEQECPHKKWVGDFSPLTYERTLGRVAEVVRAYVPASRIIENAASLGLFKGLWYFVLWLSGSCER